MSDLYNPFYLNTGFNPYYQKPTIPQYTQPIVQQNNNQNTFEWVQGKAAAEAYMVRPGVSSVILMDSQEPLLYYKSVDANGRYLPMKTYKLVEMQESGPEQIQNIDTNLFVKRDEINKLVSQAIEEYLNSPGKE